MAWTKFPSAGTDISTGAGISGIGGDGFGGGGGAGSGGEGNSGCGGGGDGGHRVKCTGGDNDGGGGEMSGGHGDCNGSSVAGGGGGRESTGGMCCWRMTSAGCIGLGLLAFWSAMPPTIKTAVARTVPMQMIMPAVILNLRINSASESFSRFDRFVPFFFLRLPCLVATSISPASTSACLLALDDRVAGGTPSGDESMLCISSAWALTFRELPFGFL